jgi:peptidyl-prolyl cis-trans isomerase D
MIFLFEKAIFFSLFLTVFDAIKSRRLYQGESFMSFVSKIRKNEDSWAVKIIMAVLGASLLFFGLSGTIFSAGQNIALQVGPRQVSIVEVDQEFKRQIAQMQSIVGRFDAASAVKMGLLDQVLDNMVYRILLDLEAEELGLYITDDKVYELLTQTKEFQDEKGNFSAERFAYVLDMNRVGEKEFISEIRAQNAREMLMNSIVSNVDISRLAWIAYSVKNEKRAIDIAVLKHSAEKIAESPSDADLAAAYEANTDKFMDPEYRAVSYFTIDAASAAKAKKIDPNDADKTYRAMHEAAEDIIDEFNGGAKAAQIAGAFGVKLADLGEMNVDGKRRDGSPVTDAAFAQKLRDIAFFAVGENSISDLIDNGDAINLVVVGKISEAKPRPFESSKAEARKIWLASKQAESAKAKAGRIMAILAGGADISNAVVSVDKGASLALSTQVGRDSPTLDPALVRRIFAAKTGETIRHSGRDGEYIAIVRKSTIPGSPGADYAQFAESQKKNIASDILDDYISFLARKYGVKKKLDVLARLAR